jgi:hypothetical protein
VRIPSPSVTQAETFILLLHILQLCKGNQFLDNLRRISGGPITPVGQIDSKFKLVSYRSTSVHKRVYCKKGLRGGPAFFSAPNVQSTVGKLIHSDFTYCCNIN